MAAPVFLALAIVLAATACARIPLPGSGRTAPEATAGSQVSPASLPDGTLVKAGGEGIYVIMGGRKSVIPNMQTFMRMGGKEDLSNVLTVSQEQLDAIPEGPPVRDFSPPVR